MSQADFNVANQSGTGFRSDVNNQLLALGTNSSGGTAPSTTFAYQFWADTTSGIHKQRNGANSGWLSKWSLDGLTLYGQELKQTVDNSSLTITGGATGGANIEVHGASSANPSYAVYDAYIHLFRNTDGSVTRAQIDQNGNFGLATTTPRGNLSIANNTIASTSTSLHLGYSTSDYYGYRLVNTSNPSLTAAGTFTIQRGTSAAWVDALSIDNSGLITAASGLSGAVTRSTAVASTSGTSISFTSLPTWVKRISIHLSGVSLSGTDNLLVRLSTGNSFVATGYLSQHIILSYISGTGLVAGGVDSTVGAILHGASGSTVAYGTYTFTNITGSTWIGSYIGSFEHVTGYLNHAACKITLGGTLDGIRLLPTGANTFDAGTVNITYEG